MAAENIARQLSIMRPYIVAELASAIENSSRSIELLGLSSKDQLDYSILKKDDPDTFFEWLRSAKKTIDQIDKLIDTIQSSR